MKQLTGDPDALVTMTVEQFNRVMVHLNHAEAMAKFGKDCGRYWANPGATMELAYAVAILEVRAYLQCRECSSPAEDGEFCALHAIQPLHAAGIAF